MPHWPRSPHFEKRDKTRISGSEQRVSDLVKQARIDTRAEQPALKEFQEEEKGISGPGKDQASPIEGKLRFSLF